MTYVELIERLEAADRLAQEQAQRAETERNRADRLAARLRELGIDPESEDDE
jgi:hypothetical protein